MQNQPLDDSLVTVRGQDGRPMSCRVLEIFDFDDHEYAILASIDSPSEELPTLLVVRLYEDAGRTLIETIESDEEFERVAAYVEILTKLKESTQKQD